MKRRWKIFIALAVVGLGGFLIWAYRAAASPVLTIRFTGYLTNAPLNFYGILLPMDGTVLAVFAVTNHSTHTMIMKSEAHVRVEDRIERRAGLWLGVTNNNPGKWTVFPILKPGEGTRVAASLDTPINPLSMTVTDCSSSQQNTWWDRIRRRLPMKAQRPYATATNEWPESRMTKVEH